jgi:hypothetical protein
MLRKRSLVVFAIIVLVIGAFGLTGCGTKAAKTTTKPKTGNSATAGTDDSTSGDMGTGLSSGQALQAVISGAQSTLEETKKSQAETYSDITLTSEGDNTLVYTYTFKNQVDGASTKTGIDAQAAQESFKSIADALWPLLKAVGVKNPAAKFVFKNADGSTITSLTYTETAGGTSAP